MILPTNTVRQYSPIGLLLAVMWLAVFVCIPSVAFASPQTTPGGEVIETSTMKDIQQDLDEGLDGLGAGSVAEKKNDGLPQLDPTWYVSQVFWMVVTFSILYFVFSSKILPDLSSSLEHRREHIQNDLDTAEKLKDQAESAQKMYEEVLQSSNQCSLEMMVQAHQDASKKLADFSSDFQQRLQRDLADTEKQIEMATIKAMSHMHDVAADIAVRAAEKICGINADAQHAKSLVETIDGRQKAA